ncbi:Pre-toxin TG [Pseudomonas pohangensis]|uniref:Pre-toxin TG n=1 Tax=Pseudomonas pohangensis TaxID=364197 RepID=A0A1H2G288_9PSED|nr:pre-toxin TG domain-containing protein [Pseudomonas pohangensis]SDU13620.1 Pre-toxin TG [Pseudomonas pohangensis]
MSIMGFQRSRLMRATSVITLAGFLAGCLPGTVKQDGTSAGGLSDAFKSALDVANSATASIGAAASSVGLGNYVGKKGMDNRQWTAQDQASANKAKSIFDNLSAITATVEVYDPLKPGEEARYKKKISEVMAKYGSQKTLTPEQLLEVTETVLPVLRFIAKSRMYREGKVIADNQNKRSTKGTTEQVWVPAGGSVELLVQTFCNDHNLPGRSPGDTYTIRSIEAYLPEQLIPAYTDVTRYSAAHPDNYYNTQSLVWYFRHNPCEEARLTGGMRTLFNNAVRPVSLAAMNSYCQMENIKSTGGSMATNIASQYAPIDPSTMANYRSMFAQAKSLSDKATMLANADYSNSTDLLQLADMAGIVPQSASSVLNNPYLREARKYTDLITPKNPSTPEEKTVAQALSVLNQIGDDLPKADGGIQPNGNYSMLPNGLAAQSSLYGPGSGKIVIKNPTGSPQPVDPSGWIATTTSSGNGNSYHPTQRLSVGPYTPVRTTAPSGSSAYTKAQEDRAKDMIASEFGKTEWSLGIPTDSTSDEPCTEIGNVEVPYLEMAVIHDVLEAVPVLGNGLSLYNAVTGHDWLTGKSIDAEEQLGAAISAISPSGGLVKLIAKMGGRLGGTAGAYKKYNQVKEAKETYDETKEFLDAVSQEDPCKKLRGLAGFAGTMACSHGSKRQCAGGAALKEAINGGMGQSKVDPSNSLFMQFNSLLD